MHESRTFWEIPLTCSTTLLICTHTCKHARTCPNVTGIVSSYVGQVPEINQIPKIPQMVKYRFWDCPRPLFYHFLDLGCLGDMAYISNELLRCLNTTLWKYQFPESAACGTPTSSTVSNVDFGKSNMVCFDDFPIVVNIADFNLSEGCFPFCESLFANLLFFIWFLINVN